MNIFGPSDLQCRLVLGVVPVKRRAFNREYRDDRREYGKASRRVQRLG